MKRSVAYVCTPNSFKSQEVQVYSEMKETTNALMQGQNMGTLTPKSSIVYYL